MRPLPKPSAIEQEILLKKFGSVRKMDKNINDIFNDDFENKIQKEITIKRKSCVRHLCCYCLKFSISGII